MTPARTPLDPQLAAVIALLPERDYTAMTPEQSRAGLLASAALRPATDDGVARTDLSVGGVPVRRYDGAGPVTVVFLHGGGWVSGDLTTHDAQCADLCRATGATVLAVDYRRAPEDPFPAGLLDALAVLRAVAADGQVAAAGDSAGANLAAAAALVLRDEGVRLRAQLLAYPATDLRGRYADDDGPYASRRDNAAGYLLGVAAMRWFAAHYVTEHQAHDPRASVLAAADLSGLPPAVVATAQYDPLRDEGAAYARALDAAGVHVVHHQGDGLVHGYWGAVTLSAAAAAETARVHASFAALLTG